MTPAAVVLGSLTIRGRPEQVSRARAFVTALAGPAAETAALLTSELVANAVLHTSSGHDGGTVTVVVSDVPDGLLVEVVDDGSPDGGPEVSGDRYATRGHGLFLVEQLAARWGFVQDGAGTTVWFQVAAGSDPARDGQLSPGPGRTGKREPERRGQRERAGRDDGRVVAREELTAVSRQHGSPRRCRTAGQCGEHRGGHGDLGGPAECGIDAHQAQITRRSQHQAARGRIEAEIAGRQCGAAFPDSASRPAG